MDYLKELVYARNYTEFFIELWSYLNGNYCLLNSEITSQTTGKQFIASILKINA